ncbi:hypothetical protein GO986_22205 [Deinococcus sp. HMF7620]|uniref:Uncharacterized protein n=1 Tax=Deinococcus arboris TaxID=2682977 RepID=A0A7C9I639_9DEIO|nr:hypothetical protein [Deinococcus arboris]MVN89451.1 hypothetical protein [Deinococcus arboris]
MLTLKMHATLATAVQVYAPRFLKTSTQRTTALNAAAQLLGYRDHRTAHHELEAGDEPTLTETIRGQAFLTRAEQALAHVCRQSGVSGHLMPADAAAFAQEMLVAYNLGLWQHLGTGEEALWALVEQGQSTVIADPRPWVSAALQRGLAQVMGERHNLEFGTMDHHNFYTVVNRRQLTGFPQEQEIRTFEGAEFWFRQEIPNSFFRARVDGSTPRLALPFLMPEFEAEYDAYMMRMCDSVHAVYAMAPQPAVAAWAALCGASPVKDGFTLIGVVEDQLTFDWVPTR